MPPIVLILLFAAGSLVSLAGTVMLLVAAFRAGILWGLAVFFLPLANVVFVVAKWELAKKAFLVQVAGLLLCAAGIAGFLASGRASKTAESAGQAPEQSGSETVAGRVQSTFESARTTFKETVLTRQPAKKTGVESYIGRPLKDLRAELGRPRGEMRFGNRIAWMYDEFTLMSEDGATVQSVVLKDFETIMASADAGQAPTGTPSRAEEKIRAVSNGGAQIELASILVPGKITVVDFYADWCGPCTVMAPDLEAIARQDPRVYLRKVDIVTWGTPVTAQFGISSIPNVRVFGSDGRMVGEPTHSMDEVRSLVQRAQ